MTFRLFPSGTDQKGFFEKRCPSHRPEWVPVALASKLAEPVPLAMSCPAPPRIRTRQLPRVAEGAQVKR